MTSTSPSLADAPRISVIVPVYNGAETLHRCLEPLLRMRRDGEIVEIIVVDDGSTDGSAAIARDLGARVVASGGRLGPGGARNVAAALAQGEVLWFVDADVIAHDDAARLVADSMRRTAAVAVFGAYDDRPPAANFLSQYKNLVHHYYHSESEGEAETFWAGCGAMRKDVFLDAGGFDAARYPRPSIEDIELGARLRQRGLRIWLVPQVQVTHLKIWRLGNLLHTEILRRALPWSRLLFARPGSSRALNLRPLERWRALLAVTAAAGIVVAGSGRAPWWLPLLLLLAAVAANAKLLRLFRRRRGSAFALAAVLFHQLYYLYGCAAYAWAWFENRWNKLCAAGRPRAAGG